MNCPILQPPAIPAQHGTRSVAVAVSGGRPGFVHFKTPPSLGKFMRGDFQQEGPRPIWRGQADKSWRLAATG